MVEKDTAEFGESRPGIRLSDSVEIAFVGPAVENGSLDLAALADSLAGTSNLVRRSGLLLSNRETSFSVELSRSFESGSVVIPITLIQHGIETAEQFLLHNQHVQALATLATLLGMGVVAPALSLLRLFRRRAGRKIRAEDLNALASEMDLNIKLELLIKIYNDPDVQAAIRQMLRPLRERGVEEFQTRRSGRVIERVTKAELFAADAAEMQEIQREEERTLEITKAALIPDLAWRFMDGSEAFDAKIQDPELWAQVERGDRFGHGDVMHVVLNTTAKRDHAGRLRRERNIPKVYSITRARNVQRSFSEGDPRET